MNSKDYKPIVTLLIESAILLNESSFINDKGEKVPKKCNKCGSKVGVFLTNI